MEEEKKNEVESVTANGRELPIVTKNNGFDVRLASAIAFAAFFIYTIAIHKTPIMGVFAGDNHGLATLLLSINYLVLVLLIAAFFVSAVCGKKHMWAIVMGSVVSEIAAIAVIFSYLPRGANLAGIILLIGVLVGVMHGSGAILGRKYLLIRKYTGRLMDKVAIVRSQKDYQALYEEISTCIKKHDEAKLNEIVTRENEYFESVKGILYFPDEAEDVIARTYNMAAVLEGEGAAKSVRKRMKGLYETRNFAEMHTIFDGYAPRYDEWIRANVHGEPAAYTPEMDGEGGFDGWLIQRWGWKILCNIVNVVTLFLAKPFTICWMMRWECKHTVYKGKRLSFDGNGLQLWGRYILWWLLCIVTLGIYTIFLPIRLEKWKAKHTHLAGEIAEYGGGFDGWVIQRLGWNILCNIVNAITLFIAYPATLCWKQKWYYKHRVYDGVRLHFDGKGIQLFGKWIQWLLLCVVTLGIYSLFLPIRVAKWKAKHVTLATYKEYWGPKVKSK